ncbi:MAG TPA: glucose-6-phosphate isomerase family protein [Methanolinea sp.]|jgi:glucose-6-phosphate isomerase|nr:glucose-6-phosphate isomerase family protein [Methanolinea sp.]HOS82172.1 glucose-6-phosphate isomerase family protein [Methanolinea sp.]HPC55942.1 glucose-6-phosphate isomerase family protein [Methanolinea sp.]HQE85470.1 glucose-6-phosphate isomerase family protein [Methanolinea sp.]HQI14735.1 glucose-6-phosphate isomerase family protein [Methanolinea sp.]
MEDWKKYAGSPVTRSVEDLRPVLRNPACDLDGPAYLMFRDIARSPVDRAWLSERHLRYDVTCIPPRDLCGEFVKTKGHYHPDNPSGMGYPEVYQVLSGRAHFLLQRRDLGRIVLVPAGEGETVLVPPGYGHVTINPGEGDLVMANIVSSCFESDYRFYEENRGAAYYELVSGELEKNPRYPSVPPAETRQPHEITPGPWRDGSLYGYVERRDEILCALVYPERYMHTLSIL